MDNNRKALTSQKEIFTFQRKKNHFIFRKFFRRIFFIQQCFNLQGFRLNLDLKGEFFLDSSEHFLSKKYCLQVRYSFILGGAKMFFLAAWAETTQQPKSKYITFHRGDFMYHRFQ
jgi:hypothetical protein